MFIMKNKLQNFVEAEPSEWSEIEWKLLTYRHLKEYKHLKNYRDLRVVLFKGLVVRKLTNI